MGEFSLVFLGDDGEFFDVYAHNMEIEEAFRNQWLNGLTWHFDGDTWSSATTRFTFADKLGCWTIGRTDTLHPIYFD